MTPLLQAIAEIVLPILLRELGSDDPALVNAIVKAAAAIAHDVEPLFKAFSDPDAPDPGLVVARDLDVATAALREQLLFELDQQAQEARFATLRDFAPPPAGAPLVVPRLPLPTPSEEVTEVFTGPLPLEETPYDDEPAQALRRPQAGDVPTTPATPTAKGLGK